LARFSLGAVRDFAKSGNLHTIALPSPRRQGDKHFRHFIGFAISSGSP
jgi:hypothetical protein